jgi:hypothetical protein
MPKLTKRGRGISALKNVFGEIRLDTRWDLNTCIKNMRKSERIIEVILQEIPITEMEKCLK